MTSLIPTIGKGQSLPDWRSDKRIAELQERRARLVERSEKVADAIAAARAELDAAEEQDRRLAAERLLGRATDEKSTVGVAEAKLRKLVDEQRDLARQLAPFDEAIAIVVGEAKAMVAQDIGRRYRAVAKRLSTALGQASDVAEELAVIYRHAESVFDGSDGALPEPGQALSWPELAVTGQTAKRGSPNESHLERFRAELAARGW